MRSGSVARVVAVLLVAALLAGCRRAVALAITQAQARISVAATAQEVGRRACIGKVLIFPGEGGPALWEARGHDDQGCAQQVEVGDSTPGFDAPPLPVLTPGRRYCLGASGYEFRERRSFERTDTLAINAPELGNDTVC